MATLIHDSASMTQVPSSAWSQDGQRYQGMTGASIDPEKGRDVNVVDWWDDNDPENPQNWRLWKARLPPAIVGGFFIPICLVWFGWSARPDIHWIMPIVGSGFFTVGALLLFNSVLNYRTDAYPVYAASVLAGNDLFRSSFGAGFPLFATAMYTDLGVSWASSTLAFLAIAFIPIPVVLMKYGETLRKNHTKRRVSTGMASNPADGAPASYHEGKHLISHSYKPIRSTTLLDNPL
ncbi:hypothetical protein BO71DRAFT_434920 [Aspergillus ellipticus CBS 707.79]|uniref:MFS general substrate transporter n=1 Tax=Aspergillus ellipticus CBS 707.79 TaxID=1448320 RepID=A0A319CWS7_9EURO|nr:hypothetical protein BO71DRAFT_434920 [Aspergillus ellipticus CBS 707.79]